MARSVVFDAEPLIAFLKDEDGVVKVQDYLTDVAHGSRDGYINPITKTEVTYVALRAGVPETTITRFMDNLAEYNIETFDVRNCWFHAASYKNEHAIPLGDAYALATARVTDSHLLVGADDDFDAIEDVSIERFRPDPV